MQFIEENMLYIVSTIKKKARSENRVDQRTEI